MCDSECVRFPVHTHADLSVDSSIQYYVVKESSLFSWRGVMLCSYLIAMLSLSLTKHYHLPLYLPISLPSMGTCLAVRAPWWLEGLAHLSRGHTYNQSQSHITKYMLSKMPWTKCRSPIFAVLGYMCVVTLVCCINTPLEWINQTACNVPLQLRYIHTY